MTDLFDVDATTTTSLDLRRIQRHRRRITRRKWTAVAVAVGLVVFSVGASIAWNLLDSFQVESNEIADFDGPGQGTIQVIVNPGDSGATIATTLYEAGVIASTQAFIQEANNNPNSSSIVPGYYFMQREMKAEFALLALLDPDNRDLLTISIPEGKKVDFYYQQIANLTDFSLAQVEAAAADTAALGLPEDADGNLEGWLFPARYEFNPGTHPTDILAEMVSTTIKVLDERGVAPEDRHTILTKASLIEREARLSEDRPMIAGVIENRLAIDMPLALDAAVKYAVPESEGAFATAEELRVDSPYNLHTNIGLPPGPIAGPGAASIEAAILPAEHDYLFFVTINFLTGETAYAENYDGHLANVALMNKWIEENQSSDDDDA